MSSQPARLEITGDTVTEEVLDWLADSAIFRGLGQRALARFADSSELRSFEALEEAIVEGEIPTALNIVVAGRFIILLPTERLTSFGDHSMVNLDCYVAGDTFGEAALMIEKQSPTRASVIATKRSQVLSISRGQFETVIGDDNRIGHVVYRNLFSIQTRRLDGPAR